MKKYLFFLLSVAVLTLNGCLERDEFNEIYKGQGNIIINFNTGNEVIVKSEDTPVEHRVDWIDIFIFDENNVLQHYERCDKTANPDFQQGHFTTDKKRENFVVNKKYFVFLVANSIADFTSLAVETSTLGDLQRVIERNENLHLSGFGMDDSPVRFVMDGVAYTGATEPELPMTMVLNDGVLNGNTELKATLRRAASKIIVNITQGDNVEFHQNLSVSTDENNTTATGNAMYSFYQLPVGTTVIAPLQGMASYVDDRINTHDISPNGTSFLWGTDNAGKPKLTITGYAYANDWSSAEMTKESSLLLNVPMEWDHDNNSETVMEGRPNNWFKIPLSRESKFERNKCYVVNIKINAIGAESKSSAIELDDIEYVTADWITTIINVGQNENGPEYLMLNKDTVEIFNTNFDFHSLNFTSSSEIVSIGLVDINTDGSKAYYYNKYNAKKELGTGITGSISAIPEDNVLNGDIYIISPMQSSTQQEINNAIAKLKEPVEPIMPEGAPERPQEPAGKPTEVEEPDPNDYVPNTDDWYEYRYLNGKFQRKFRYFGNWEDYDTPQDYTDALSAYNNYLKALQSWKNSEAYRQYLQALEEYNNDPTLKEYLDKYAMYEQRLAEYNEALNAINATASASESHYNSIRYLEFRVTNAQGVTATFVVKQYPNIYITNSLGWYSYREDFKTTSSQATTYHIKGDRISSIAYNKGTYTLIQGSPSNNKPFWYSRYSNHPESTHVGTATHYPYYWSSNNSTNVSTYGSTDNDNTRMYHIRVASTSNDFTVGIPMKKMVKNNINYNGSIKEVEYLTTDDSDANSKLVSPSFMTASRLGVLTTGNMTFTNSNDNNEKYEVFSYHCANYVEVKKIIVNGVEKKVVYDDWRLPTAAEIAFIISVQSETKDVDDPAAIDYLLNAQYYFSASGPVQNNKYDSNGTSVRCVRDAFNEPEPIDLNQ